MYKESKYNFLVYYDSHPLLYNGITGNGFCMNNDEWNVLRKLLNSPDDFKRLYPFDFERMKQGLGAAFLPYMEMYSEDLIKVWILV